ncbi:NAD(P)-dependent oxidoreductase [Streptomyces sp. HNM0575]|uniref:NAD-dependent epimerase/dehydratase family protein n=1 Tax=Streptomyces sp. HNM0575 TaxID=2716338 RepID=UPI00145C9573|nr:NAD(P)-dependent oxidoreductase [Streptomyces sp. HNM0575]NLU76631.1 NAD(P)-dependent oxidoreductase [Streptomyces sp. HNM0575]
MTARVVLTGASGFIGSAVLRRLTGQDADVRVLARRDLPLPAGVEQVHADLARPGTLTGACSGARVLVHAASHIGSDEQLCTRVNDLGTDALMREAERAGVERIVSLSTTAVYGRGPHRGAAVGDLEPAPGSPASRSRLAGEAHALRHGALVLRTGLVTGAGDRWVVPALAELVRRVPGHWRGGRAELSMIDVNDLARLVTTAALATTGPSGSGDPARGVRHAVHPEPVRNRDLLGRLAQLGVLPPVRGELTWRECQDLLEAHPGRVGERQLRLLAFDHHYATDVWQACRSAPGEGPLAALGEAAPWYRAHLARTASS